MPKLEYNKFNAGERVAVYTGGIRYTGTVQWYEGVSGLLVKIDNTANFITVHEKQCRRLKQAARKRLWVFEAQLEFLISSVTAYPNNKHHSKEAPMVEFVEVKRSKK